MSFIKILPMVATIVFAAVAQVPDRHYTDNGHPDLLSAYEDDINRIVSARINGFYEPRFVHSIPVSSYALNLFYQEDFLAKKNNPDALRVHILMIAGEAAKKCLRYMRFGSQEPRASYQKIYPDFLDRNTWGRLQKKGRQRQ